MRSFTKFAICVSAVAALSFTVAACGGDDTTAGGDSTETAAPSKPSNCESADNLCVGLVTDVGKVDDKSFNQSAYEGAKQVEKDMGA
jgi:basic membrane protein A